MNWIIPELVHHRKVVQQLPERIEIALLGGATYPLIDHPGFNRVIGQLLRFTLTISMVSSVVRHETVETVRNTMKCDWIARLKTERE